MTNKKAFLFALISLLTVTVLMGSLAVKAPAMAASEREGLSAWTPQLNDLASQQVAPEAVCTPDTTAMLSYWPLDEISGTDFFDVIDGNDGSCTNCPAPMAGIVGGAQQFVASQSDGVSITESVGNELSWGNGDSFSFEMWANFAEDCSGNTVFFGRYRAGVTPESQWWVGCQTGGVPAFQLKDSTPSAAITTTGPTAINDGAWHHVVGVRDGSTGENLLYVDGELAASQSAAYAGTFVSTGPTTMGYYAVSPFYYYDGLLDEVAVYDKALSATEIANHYNAGLGQSYCNEAPVAGDDELATDEDSNLDFTGDELLANDEDPDGSPVAIESIDTASVEGGTITDLGGGSYQYSPPADFFGTDTFTYTITDGGDTGSATVSVTVNSVNDVPVAEDQFVTTEEDAAVDITLGATDLEDDPLTFSVVDAPLHGTLSGTAPDLTYTPEADFYGSDSFTFKANDGTDDSNVATVSITIDAGPEAVDDNLATEENTEVDFTEADLLANDSHPEAEPFSITTVDTASAEGGTIADLGGGSYQYSPPTDFAGTDSFTYTVEDESGGTDTATVFVTVGVNDAPLADDQEVSVPVNSEVEITLTATDADGDELTLSVVDGPQHGILSGSGAVLTYTPDADYVGSDSFTFKANDGTVDSNIATVTITVTEAGPVVFLPLIGRGTD